MKTFLNVIRTFKNNCTDKGYSVSMTKKIPIKNILNQLHHFISNIAWLLYFSALGFAVCAAPLSGLSDLLFIIRDALRTSHIRPPPAPAFFSNFFPFSCDLLKNKLSKSRACSVRALLLKNAAVPSLETLYRLSGPTKAVSEGEKNTSRQPWHQRNPQKKTEPEICLWGRRRELFHQQGALLHCENTTLCIL